MGGGESPQRTTNLLFDLRGRVFIVAPEHSGRSTDGCLPGTKFGSEDLGVRRGECRFLVVCKPYKSGRIRMSLVFEVPVGGEPKWSHSVLCFSKRKTARNGEQGWFT